MTEFNTNLLSNLKKFIAYLENNDVDLNYQDVSCNYTILMYTVKFRKYAHMKYLLEYSSKKLTKEELRTNIAISRNDNITAITIAIIEKRHDCFELLLEYIDDIEFTDERGLTLLCHAILYQNDKIINLLLEKGANVNINNIYNINGYNSTILTMDSNFIHFKYINKLLKYGLNINIRNGNNATLLHDICQRGDISYLKLIIF